MLNEDAAPLDVGIGQLGERANKPDAYVFLFVSDAQVDVVLGRDQFSLDRPARPDSPLPKDASALLDLG
jgi:hypothetical protein